MVVCLIFFRMRDASLILSGRVFVCFSVSSACPIDPSWRKFSDPKSAWLKLNLETGWNYLQDPSYSLQEEDSVTGWMLYKLYTGIMPLNQVLLHLSKSPTCAWKWIGNKLERMQKYLLYQKDLTLLSDMVQIWALIKQTDEHQRFSRVTFRANHWISSEHNSCLLILNLRRVSWDGGGVCNGNKLIIASICTSSIHPGTIQQTKLLLKIAV